MDPEIKEIQEREAQSGENSGNGGGDDDPVADAVDNSGTSGLSLGLTRRQLLLIGLVVALVLAWKLRQASSDGGSSSKASEAVEKLRTEDLAGDVEVQADEDAEEPQMELRVPTDPGDELDKDAAVLDYFKDSGIMGGGD